MNNKIINMIHKVNGKEVIYDTNLSKLYKVDIENIELVVENNKERFPDRYTWVYNNKRVFTEQGVAMLGMLLKSDIATNISIEIIDSFIKMRNYIPNKRNDMLLKHEKEINELKKVFRNFKEKPNHIFFEGQIYDSYSLMIDIFNKSEDSIIIIDNYIDKKLLDILSKTEKEVLIITNKINKIDVSKYNKQYNNINIIFKNIFHDRFILIDGNILYHCGASFKDLGKKCFAITKINDDKILNDIKTYI